MAIKIFFGNYKGGVGKTTTVFQTAINIATNHNKKVLLLDLDPQASLSKICAKTTEETINSRLEDINITRTLNYLIELYVSSYRRYSKLDILKNEDDTKLANFTKNAIFQNKTCENFYFIPTRMDIANARINDLAEQSSRYSTGIVGIAKLLEDLEKNCEINFDYIFVDCPPALNSIIQATFLKCDYYMIPTIADTISTDGVMDYIRVIEKTILQYTYDSTIGGILLEKVFGKTPILLGILETMHSEKTANATDAIMMSLNNQLIDAKIQLFQNSAKYMMNSKNNEKSYIFDTKISRLNNSSSPIEKQGIPQLTSKGMLHTEYSVIAKIIVEMMKN